MRTKKLSLGTRGKISFIFERQPGVKVIIGCMAAAVLIIVTFHLFESLNQEIIVVLVDRMTSFKKKKYNKNPDNYVVIKQAK